MPQIRELEALSQLLTTRGQQIALEPLQDHDVIVITALSFFKINLPVCVRRMTNSSHTHTHTHVK